MCRILWFSFGSKSERLVNRVQLFSIPPPTGQDERQQNDDGSLLESRYAIHLDQYTAFNLPLLHRLCLNDGILRSWRFG